MREPTAYNINEDQIDPFNRRHINRRFAEAVAQLGPEGKNTWGFFWTIRPKNDQASWDRCDAIAEGVVKKLTRTLWASTLTLIVAAVPTPAMLISSLPVVDPL